MSKDDPTNAGMDIQENPNDQTHAVTVIVHCRDLSIQPGNRACCVLSERFLPDKGFATEQDQPAGVLEVPTSHMTGILQ